MHTAPVPTAALTPQPGDALATSPPAGRKKGYLVGLDSLRAVAALSVCLFHYTGAMLPKLIVPEAKALFSNGYLGVDIFFVISGFIIPYSLLGKNYRVATLGAYLKKRIFRINPPAYVSLFLVLAQWFFIDKMINHNATYTSGLSWSILAHNLLFTIPFTHYHWINGIFWTLAIEFQFYLFIGLLFNVLFDRPVVWFVVVYLLAAAASFVPHTQALGFLHYSPLFALGGLALLWQQGRLSNVAYGLGLLAFGVLTGWQLSTYAALVGVGTALAIHSLKVAIPGLSFLGKISYSFYLMHGLIGTTAEFLLIKLLPPTSDARKLLLTACALLLAIGGSYVFYLLVEKPFMRLAAQARS
jgi:peptidoglycan/LPS O-acetylase OafA/YrhL